MPYRLLIVDDEPAIRRTLEGAFRHQPWEVDSVGGGDEAVRELARRSVDVALLDVNMPDVDGMQVLETVRRRRIQTDIVVLTGYGTIDLAVDAMKLGARDFVVKPADLVDLVDKVSGIMNQRHPARNTLARRLDRYLRRNLADTSLDLKRISGQFGISERYVCRQFRDGFDTTFRSRLNRHRIDEAKRLIETTGLSMLRVSERCGYRNQRRFSEAFRRMERITPRSYRHSLVVMEDDGY